MDKKEEILRKHHEKLTAQALNYLTFEEGQAQQPELLNMVYEVMQEYSDHEKKDLESRLGLVVIEIAKRDTIITAQQEQNVALREVSDIRDKIISNTEAQKNMILGLVMKIDHELDKGGTISKGGLAHHALKKFLTSITGNEIRPDITNN